MASERTAAVNALPALPRVVDLDIDARRALTGTQLLTVSLWLERDEGLGATPDRLEAIHPPKNRTPSARPQRDAVMDPMVRQMWEDNFRVYGAQQIWKAARRAGSDIGRDQVARLMRTDGIEGARTIASMRGGLR